MTHSHLSRLLIVLGNVGVLVKTKYFRVGYQRQTADVGEVGLVRTDRRRVVEATRRKPTHTYTRHHRRRTRVVSPSSGSNNTNSIDQF